MALKRSHFTGGHVRGGSRGRRTRVDNLRGPGSYSRLGCGAGCGVTSPSS